MPQKYTSVATYGQKRYDRIFFGDSSSFFAKDRKFTATMAVRSIEGSHTGDNIFSIFKTVLEEWQRDRVSVGKVLMDNGSNMFKAFRIMAADFTENDEEFENEDDNSIIEISKEDNEDIPDLDNGSESDDNIVEDNGESEDVPKEVMDCERSEADFDTAFSSRSFERLSCFPHMLQLVVSKFDEVHACKDAISRSKKIVARVNKSCKATEMLRKMAKVKLIGDCPTRWSSTFLLLQQLLRVKCHLEIVLQKKGWG